MKLRIFKFKKVKSTNNTAIRIIKNSNFNFGMVYSETQTLSTNGYGVVSLNIGAGTVVSGDFTTIDWGNNTYFVKNNIKLHAYIKEGTDKIIKFAKPISFSKSRRKFKKLNIDNYEVKLW